MKYLGTLADYDFYICKTKTKEADPAIKSIDFTEANGITDFDTRKVLILETVDVREKLTVLCHEIVHMYMERWGFHDMYSNKQREFMAQFFGSMMSDVAIRHKDTFYSIVEGIKSFKLEPEGEENGASRTEAVPEGGLE